IEQTLPLRIRPLPDREEREMRAAAVRARALLDRTEALGPEQLLSLHGTIRRPPTLRPGDRVRLRPRRCADAIDLLLAGLTATVTAVERDFEGRVHVAVTVDEDPGRDLGDRGQPGHRLFFGPEEVEPLDERPPSP